MLVTMRWEQVEAEVNETLGSDLGLPVWLLDYLLLPHMAAGQMGVNLSCGNAGMAQQFLQVPE